MNLKAAAHELDVHYQTAYKWVRSGQLTAVRIGGRYDVSEAAIVRFRSGRAAALVEGDSQPRNRESDLTGDDVLEELEAIAIDPIMERAAVAAFVARRGAASLGDACIIALVSTDGRQVTHQSIEHPDSHRTAFLGAVSGMVGRDFAARPTEDTGPLAQAFRTGRAVRIPHVSQDVLRTETAPELRQFLHECPTRSALAAPITASGTPIGAIGFTRDTGDRPYSAADEEFAVQLGVRTGKLMQTADEIALAWQIKRDVIEQLTDLVLHRRVTGPLTPDELDARFREDPLPDGLPVRILSPELRYIATNHLYLAEIGRTRETFVGRHVTDLTRPEDHRSEFASFERLVSGELDHVFHRGRAVRSDGREILYASHRGAVRYPGAALACLISVLRPFHLTNSDASEIGFA